jgi:hypothetical protein
MYVITTISIIIVVGLLLVAFVYFYMKNHDMSKKSKNSTPIEFSDDMSEKYKSISSESSESSEDSENSEEELPQFTTEQQFENVQSNIFNPKVQETEIRVWDDGYATQGLGVVGYK